MSDTRVAVPHAGWWIAVLGGLGLLTVLAFSTAAHAAVAHRMPFFPRDFLQGVFVVAIFLHVSEAFIAFRLARRLGGHVAGWSVQTLLLGYPSLKLLRRKLRGQSARA